MDLGVKDAANMGAAMAPAAATSIYEFLEDTGTVPPITTEFLQGIWVWWGTRLLFQTLGKMEST